MVRNYDEATFPCTLIEPGLLGWRSSTLDAEGFPASLHFHDTTAASAVDAVYYARVTALDSANDMAFFDLGGGASGVMNLRRAGLLVKGRPSGIGECLTEGENLLVQALSDPSALEAKSVQLTPRPRIAGRYVVIETGGARLNFSKDLPPHLIGPLKGELSELAESYAIIVRSRAHLADAKTVAAEAKTIISAINGTPAKPGLVFAYKPSEQALLACGESDTPIYVEGAGAAKGLQKLAREKYPDLTDRITPYTGTAAMMEEFGVEESIEEALADKIHLPSGGWITIHPTPALTAIDVNLGGALKGRTAADAKLTVNMEAALAIMHHLKFQDIGGLIVIDFIDMTAKGAARDLLSLLDAQIKEDPAPVQRTNVSNFGLVEMTRKRRGLSLRDRMLIQRAPVERVQAAGADLVRKSIKAGKSNEPGTLIIACSDAVQAWLKDHGLIAAIEKETQRSVSLKTAADNAAYIGDA